jgi:hypothetical protein
VAWRSSMYGQEEGRVGLVGGEGGVGQSVHVSPCSSREVCLCAMVLPLPTCIPCVAPHQEWHHAVTAYCAVGGSGSVSLVICDRLAGLDTTIGHYIFIPDLGCCLTVPSTPSRHMAADRCRRPLGFCGCHHPQGQGAQCSATAHPQGLRTTYSSSSYPFMQEWQRSRSQRPLPCAGKPYLPP